MSRKFEGLMIMTDLDGTFLGGHSELLPRNLEAVEYFKSEGGLFTFATGRTASNLFSAVPEPERIVNAPLSLGNGCCLYDAAARRSIRDYIMAQPEAYELARWLRESYPELGMRVSTVHEGFLYEPEDDLTRKNLRRVPADAQTTRPIAEWGCGDWYKIVLIGEPERLEQVRAESRARYGDVLGIDKSGKRLLEFHRFDRTKAAMLPDLRQLYDRPGRPLTICCVGDFENDIDMLRAADIAACPGNATDAVKRICRLCMCPNTDGVIGDLVEYFDNNYDSTCGAVDTDED